MSVRNTCVLIHLHWALCSLRISWCFVKLVLTKYGILDHTVVNPLTHWLGNSAQAKLGIQRSRTVKSGHQGAYSLSCVHLFWTYHTERTYCRSLEGRCRRNPGRKTNTHLKQGQYSRDEYQCKEIEKNKSKIRSGLSSGGRASTTQSKSYLPTSAVF